MKFGDTKNRTINSRHGSSDRKKASGSKKLQTWKLGGDKLRSMWNMNGNSRMRWRRGMNRSDSFVNSFKKGIGSWMMYDVHGKKYSPLDKRGWMQDASGRKQYMTETSKFNGFRSENAN